MLQTHLLYSTRWLAQIWTNRNRDYGAYQLRSTYARRLTRAVAWVYGVAIALAAIPVAFNVAVRTAVRHSMAEIEQQTEMKQLDIEELNKLHRVSPGRQATAAAAPEASGGEIAIVDTIPPTVAEVAQQGPTTMQVGETTIVRLVQDSVLQLDSLAPVIEEEIKDTEILPGVPDFPGGYVALTRWLDRHIEYPKEAIAAKIEGDVVVCVTIDALGRATEPRVSQSAHPLLDAAALNAVKRMPLWRWRDDGTLHKARIYIPVSFHAD